jgi:hypothetical protein
MKECVGLLENAATNRNEGAFSHHKLLKFARSLQICVNSLHTGESNPQPSTVDYNLRLYCTAALLRTMYALK